MGVLHYEYKGKLYDEWELNKDYVTMPHTITEGEMLRYCGLAGDYNPFYVYKEFAKQGMYGDIVVPSAYVFCLCNGQTCLTQWMDGAYIGLLDQSQEFVAPVYVGDTLYTVMTPVAKRLTKKPGRGIVTFRIAMYNQKDELVMDGEWIILIAADKEHME